MDRSALAGHFFYHWQGKSEILHTYIKSSNLEKRSRAKLLYLAQKMRYGEKTDI